MPAPRRTAQGAAGSRMPRASHRRCRAETRDRLPVSCSSSLTTQTRQSLDPKVKPSKVSTTVFHLRSIFLPHSGSELLQQELASPGKDVLEAAQQKARRLLAGEGQGLPRAHRGGQAGAPRFLPLAAKPRRGRTSGPAVSVLPGRASRAAERTVCVAVAAGAVRAALGTGSRGRQMTLQSVHSRVCADADGLRGPPSDR